MKTLLASIVTTLCLASPLFAQPATPLAERVPQGAMLYVGWAGADLIGEGFGETRTKALLDASSLPEVATAYVPELLAALAREEPEAAPFVRFADKAGPILWRRPHALAFGGIDWESDQNDGKPMPRLLLMVDAAGEAADLRAALNELFQAVDKPVLSALVKEQDGVVYASLGYADLELAAAGQGLAAGEPFASAVAALPGGFGQGTAFSFYLDTPAVRDFALELVEREEGGQTAAEVRKGFTAAGLDGIGAVSYAAGFDGGDFVASAFVGLSAERTGVLRLLPPVGEGLDEQTLAMVPSDATSLAAARVQLDELLPVIRQIVADVSPENAENLEQVLLMGGMLAGANVEEDLFAGFGSTWAAFVSPAVGSDLISGVVVNRPGDAASFKNTLRSVSLNVVNAANGEIRKETEGLMAIPARSFTQGDAELFVLNTPGLAPTWTVAGESLMVGLLPQAVTGAMAGEGGFAASEVGREVMALTGGATPIGLTYADLPATAAAKYPAVLLVAQLGFGAGDLFGDYLRTRPPVVVLPDLPTLREQLTPAYSAAWQDERGVYSRGVMPFPAANLLVDFGHVGTLLELFNPVLSSVPALIGGLSGSRESAMRVHSASNLRQIGVGLHLYANENDGEFPPTLSALFPDYGMSPGVFVNPRTGASGHGMMAQAIEVQKAWIDDNSDYVYAAAGVNQRDIENSPQVPIAWEEPMAMSDGINVLFADCHVEFVAFPRAFDVIAGAPREVDPMGNVVLEEVMDEVEE